MNILLIFIFFFNLFIYLMKHTYIEILFHTYIIVFFDLMEEYFNSWFNDYYLLY